MKAKKILAMVLALMMVISMLPVNALAANTATATENIMKVALTVGTKFGTKYIIGEEDNAENGETDDVTVSSIAEYNAIMADEDPEIIGGVKLTSGNYTDNGPTNIALADKAFTSKTDTVSEVSSADTIYVGVKLTGESLNSSLCGAVGGTVFLQYDPTKIETIATGATDVAQNLAVQGLFNATGKNRSDAKAYCSSASLDAASSVFGVKGSNATQSGNGNDYSKYKYVGLTYSIPDNATFPLLQKNSWDFVVPFKVLAKSGSTTISVAPRAYYQFSGASKANPTYAQFSHLNFTGTTSITGGGSEDTTIKGDENKDNFTANDVTISFTSSDPGASIPENSSIKDVAGQSLTVTLKNCDFNSGAAATATNFSVIPAAGGSAITGAVTASKAGTGTKEAVLTIDGSKLTAGTDAYKITVANTAVTGSPASALETGTFSVTAAPKPLTASFNYGTNELSVTESVAWAWKIKTDKNTEYAKHEVTAGAKATLTETDLAKIRTAMGNNNTLADAIQVIAQTDTAYEAVKNVSITKEANPTAANALELDFTAAQATAKANTDYEVKSGDNYVTTAVNVASGDTVTFRKAHGTNSIASNNASYTVDAAGTLTGITTTTDRAKKLNGQTTVGGVQEKDQVKVGNSTPATVGASATTLDVAATEGQKITVTRPGTKGPAGTAKPSSTANNIDGVGFKAPTVVITKPATKTSNLVLTIKDGKGDFVDNTVVTITGGTAGAATLSSSSSTDTTWKDVITIAPPTGGWTEDSVTYNIAVAKTGTTPNLANAISDSFKVNSEAGYTLPAKVTVDGKDLALTSSTGSLSFKANDPKATITVAVPTGKTLNNVTVGANQGTIGKVDQDAGTFEYTAPTTKPSAEVNVDVTITLDAKVYKLKYDNVALLATGTALDIAPKADTYDADMSDLTVTVTPAPSTGAITGVTIDSTDGTVKIAAANNLQSNVLYTFTVASVIADYETSFTVQMGKDPAYAKVASKEYDGTKAVPAANVEVYKKADFSGDKLTITVTGATYDNANVGSGKAVSIANATISGADAANYTVNTSGITGEITQKTIASDAVTAAPASGAAASKVGSVDEIVTAIKALPVSITGITPDDPFGTVAENTNASDGDIKALVQTAVDAIADAGFKTTPEQQVAANVVNADASKASAAPIAVEQYATGVITLTGVPANASVALKTAVTGVSIDSNNNVKLDGTYTSGSTITVTVTPETGDPYDVEIAVTTKNDPTENVYDWTKLGDHDIEIEILISGDIATNTTGASNIKVTLPITKKSSSSGGGNPYLPDAGHTVTIENTGYGSVDTTAITTDEDGKIVSLPTVTNVKKGVSFVGWSTNGQISGVIDPNTFRVQNDELTLTAVYQGYMAGYEDSTARPNKQITRAELLKMLIVATGDYDATKNYGTSTFTDVKNAWYVNYIACAQQSGKDIIAGYGDGTFKPNAPVTRNEAARMICQAFGVTVSEGDTTNKVNDFSKVAGWAQKYVAALCNNGTIHGYEDGEFKGDRAVTRGESSVMINGYLGLTDAAKEQLRNDPALKNIFKDMTDKQAWNFIDVLFAAMCAPASYYSDEITMPQA